ncbi:MAG TPA: PQQ-dependent sugar dehydrogenase, partial [Burkholderiaceae bacterium]|nr:PQQ-dependent sugar dehydrogenase [Burkholderiaceae bacterium]
SENLKRTSMARSRLLILGLVLQLAATLAPAQVIATKQHQVRIVTVLSGLEHPWALAFLPDGRMLVTERPGRMRVIDRGGKLDPVPIAVCRVSTHKARVACLM